jgi:hypothetical protein
MEALSRQGIGKTLTLPDSMSKEKAALAANASLWPPFSAWFLSIWSLLPRQK